MAIPSFPDVHVTGPVHHFIRVNYLEGDVFYLGTAEVTPQIQVRRYRQNVMNDLAGKTLPFQKTWDGEAATVSCLFTRFSKFAEEQLQASGQAGGIHFIAGQETRWARGSTVYGKATFELWQVYDNFFNPFGASTGLEIGWYWPQVEMLQRDDVKIGSQAEGLLMVFDCTPFWIDDGAGGANGSTSFAPGIPRGWMLYSQRELYFPNEVKEPQ